MKATLLLENQKLRLAFRSELRRRGVLSKLKFLQSVKTFAMHLSTLFRLAIFALAISESIGLKCYSCFMACKDPDDPSCDCTDGDACETSHYCYTRVVVYNGKARFGIHKGCIGHVGQGEQHADHCLIDASDRSAECICNGKNYCNSKAMFKSEIAKTLDTTECCVSEDLAGEDEDEPQAAALSADERPPSCSRVCKGAYCYDDELLQEKACGHGKSELLKLLRFRQVLPQISKVCAKFWYGEKNVNQHGCVCANGKYCNSANPSEDSAGLQRKFTRESAKIQCKMCIRGISDSKADVDTCAGSNHTCFGHYCYVLYRSEQFSQFYDDDTGDLGPPERDLVHSTQYGCVLTDAERKHIQMGCTRESASYVDEIEENNDEEDEADDEDGSRRRRRRRRSASTEQTRRGDRFTFVACVCDKSFCNSDELLFASGERALELLQNDPPSSAGRSSFRLCLLLVCSVLTIIFR